MFNAYKVKEELKEQRYSQAQLANFLGIAPSTLSDKLTGKSKFNADEAFRIAKFFNRDLEYFYNS